MNGEIDKSNSVLYNEVIQMKEKHYPLGLIERNRDKVDYYNGRLYSVIRMFVDDASAYDDHNDAIPVGAE
jgi:hypothetical protein